MHSPFDVSITRTLIKDRDTAIFSKQMYMPNEMIAHTPIQQRGICDDNLAMTDCT